ncbi:TolC family outer membrane protein [Methylovirgula sp. HY1]|uniref:TolC family outer membrane protein n=1 Tax=Methylovirgula sp. HY1 TaxID=2822761 RepID=UPI001C5B952F|nr:TolC family outer membrane protein [Methylovirgula sp. HY1]QXX74183.1 Outer membrane efflux protein BepC [Methylovirgula sp. HY1]
MGISAAHAETMSGALARAYGNNPSLNQQRAGVRATDETVAQATADYRPTVSVTGQYGVANFAATGAGAGAGLFGGSVLTEPSNVAVTVTQTVFDGNRNYNGVRQAESNVFGARENLRNTQEVVLQNGATAYMNVLRDTAILDLRKNNIIVLEEQLRQTRDRFNVGEVTRTDVAQAESSLASARSDYFTAQANLQTSIAGYRQVIGVQPTRLQPARTIEALLPHTLQQAVFLGLSEHPAVQAALHAADAAALQVKLAEGQLYPKVTVSGSAERDWNYFYEPGLKAFIGAVTGQVTIPIYTGGSVDAQVRQAKELYTQARIQADVQRDAVRANVVTSWGLLDAAKAAIKSNEAAVKAAVIALEGVREEAKVGQRTTLDVLNAQQTLLNARVSLVSAQRDRVVASYVVMAAIGRLDAANLRLDVVQYDPTVHFDQVKDKWIGLRTPDGH